MQLILVSGPWGSGSSALAGALTRLGVQAPGPFFQTADPRTPNSFEMVGFRNLILQLADEASLQRRCDPSVALQAIRHFHRQLIQAPQLDPSRPLLLKLPLSALFLAELSQVFELRLPICLRSLTAIEATRQRRGWPAHLGALGAQPLYGAIFTHVVNGDTPAQLVRFDALRQQPGQTLADVIRFCRLEPSADQLEAAVRSIQPAPGAGAGAA